jgi:hypothetical protein
MTSPAGRLHVSAAVSNRAVPHPRHGGYTDGVGPFLFVAAGISCQAGPSAVFVSMIVESA